MMVWEEAFIRPPLCVWMCFPWDHIPDDCRKKLDLKSHACIMMGYSEESKSYRLFDLVKWKIIIKCNVWFDEKSSSIKLLNSSSVLLQDDPFDVVSDVASLVQYFVPSTRQSNILPILTRLSISESTSPSFFVSTGPPTVDPTTFDRPN
jgi:hypothetical protein